MELSPRPLSAVSIYHIVWIISLISFYHLSVVPAMMKSKGSSTTDATVPDVIRSSIWFQDGNIVLLGQKSVAFKVHRGQLERHSEIFRDLFSIPQPGNQVLLEGCCMVELHDDPSDVFCLLSALYDGLWASLSFQLNAS